MSPQKRVFRAWFHPSQVEQGRRFVDTALADSKAMHRCNNPDCAIKHGIIVTQADATVPVGYYRRQGPGDLNWREVPLGDGFVAAALSRQREPPKIAMRVHPEDYALAVDSRVRFEQSAFWKQAKPHVVEMLFQADPDVPRGRMRRYDPVTRKDADYPLPIPGNELEAATGLAAAFDRAPSLLNIPAFASLAKAIGLEVLDEDIVIRARSSDMAHVRTCVQEQMAELHAKGLSTAPASFEVDDTLPVDHFTIIRPLAKTARRYVVPGSAAA